MCKAIDDMIKENMEIGRAEGRKEGRAEGERQGEILAFTKLICAKKLTASEAAAMTGMTEETFLQEMEKLK